MFYKRRQKKKCILFRRKCIAIGGCHDFFLFMCLDISIIFIDVTPLHAQSQFFVISILFLVLLLAARLQWCNMKWKKLNAVEKTCKKRWRNKFNLKQLRILIAGICLNHNRSTRNSVRSFTHSRDSCNNWIIQFRKCKPYIKVMLFEKKMKRKYLI